MAYVKYLACCLNRIWTAPVSYSKCPWHSVGTHNALRLWVCPWGVLTLSMRYWACPLAIRICSGAVWCLGTEGFWKILVVGRCQRGCQHGQLRSRGNPQWIPAAARITAEDHSTHCQHILSLHPSITQYFSLISLSQFAPFIFLFALLIFLSFQRLLCILSFL